MTTYNEILDALSSKEKSTKDEVIANWSKKNADLIIAIKKRDIAEQDMANDFASLYHILSGDHDGKKLRLFYNQLLAKMKKEYQLITPKHYLKLFMLLGMTLFGVPFGFIFGAALGNMAFFGIGLPIGMPIGMAIGALKDKKALEQGKVLEI
jgi:hypothetical protein